MDDVISIGEIDLLSDAYVRRLAERQGRPCVSLFMPTHRAGPQTRQDPLRFRNLLDVAAARLEEDGHGPRDVADLLAPVAGLDQDTLFWRHLADGLAVFLAPGFHRHFRVPLTLEEEVTVGTGFRLRPLLPLISEDGHFFILTLSQKDVRLFAATRATIGQLDLGATPTTMADALAHEDHERQLQVRSAGKASAPGRSMFHGHGAGAEVDKAALERYFRVVDAGVETTLGEVRGRGPVVLACVGYYAPIFRAVTGLGAVADTCLEGSPDDHSPEELHARAWPVVAPILSASRRDAEARLAAAAGTGRSLDDPAAVAVAAHQGRVDTLFVTPSGSYWGRLNADGTGTEPADGPGPDAEDLLERAARETLVTGGTVFVTDAAELPGRHPVAALLRY